MICNLVRKFFRYHKPECSTLMYVVHNPTSRIVVLSDLHADIGPHKILDLEYVASRDLIDRSRDLQIALKNKNLQLVKFSTVNTFQDINNERQIDDSKFKEMIKEIISEEINKKSSDGIEDSVRSIISDGVKSLQDTIRSHINNPIANKGNNVSDEIETEIDLSKLAELQQKSIDKIVKEVETSGNKSKKINIINSNIDNLANEL